MRYTPLSRGGRTRMTTRGYSPYWNSLDCTVNRGRTFLSSVTASTVAARRQVRATTSIAQHSVSLLRTAISDPSPQMNFCLVFGIRDSKTRERLLREPALTLKRADELCRSAQSTGTQLRLVEDGQGAIVSAVAPPTRTAQNCPNCSR